MTLQTHCGFLKNTQFLLVCMQTRFGPPHSYDRAKKDNPLQKWLMTLLERILMVKYTTPSWCVMRECGLEPLQFNWSQAAVRLYNALTQGWSVRQFWIFNAGMVL